MSKIPKEFSDIKVEIEGKIFYLHRIILNKIPFFQTAFKTLKGDTIQIDNISRKSFENIINVIYRDILLNEDFSFKEDDAKTANFLGFGKFDEDEKLKEIENNIEKAVSRFEEEKSVNLKLKDLDYYLLNTDKKIDSDFIVAAFIDSLIKKKELENFPFVYFHYQAIRKYDSQEYDKDTDITDVYNLLFNKNVDKIDMDDAIDYYIEHRLNKLPPWKPNLTKEGMEALKEDIKKSLGYVKYYPYENIEKIFNDFLNRGKVENEKDARTLAEAIRWNSGYSIFEKGFLKAERLVHQ